MTENRYWRLNAYPDGSAFSDALSLEHEALPELADGDVLIKNQWLSMDAGTRMWMTPRTDGYQPPLPLGSKMAGLCLGHVVESRHAHFQAGDFVRCFGQWADFAMVKPELSALEKVDSVIPDMRQHFGALGMNAWTAYAGLVDIAKVQAGETVLVSAAAGATGSLVCQIARNLGARVIGLAGTDDKCRYVTEQLGAAQAINYKTQNVADVLSRIDGGIHVYFDNVGGPLLDAVLPSMAHYGRIALCGLVSVYDQHQAMPGPARFDQILMRRLNITGFFIPDFLHRSAEYLPILKRWMTEGKLDVLFDEAHGLENTLVAYERMLSGKSTGKVIIDLRG